MAKTATDQAAKQKPEQLELFWVPDYNRVVKAKDLDDAIKIAKQESEQAKQDTNE